MVNWKGGVNIKRLAMFIIFIFLGGVLLTGCNQQKQTQAPVPKVKEKLIVGGVTGFYPFQMMDKKGNLIGYNIDLLNQMSQYLNVELEFQNYDRVASLISALQANKVDFIISAITITEKRKEVVDFSDTYLENYLFVAVTNKHKHLKNWEELDRPDITVAVSLGSTADTAADKMFKHANVKKFDGVALVRQAILSNKADAIISDEFFIKPLQVMNSDNISLIGSRLGSPEPVGIAVAKGNKELLDKINAFLKHYKESGAANRNYEKWLNNEDWGNAVPPKNE